MGRFRISSSRHADGLAISRSPYRRWRILCGPSRMPETVYGFGLPGNPIHGSLVTPQKRVLVGTDLGLAGSTDDRRTFRYERGSDDAANVQGLWRPPRYFRPPAEPNRGVATATKEGVRASRGSRLARRWKRILIDRDSRCRSTLPTTRGAQG